MWKRRMKNCVFFVMFVGFDSFSVILFLRVGVCVFCVCCVLARVSWQDVACIACCPLLHPPWKLASLHPIAFLTVLFPRCTLLEVRLTLPLASFAFWFACTRKMSRSNHTLPPVIPLSSQKKKKKTLLRNHLEHNNKVWLNLRYRNITASSTKLWWMRSKGITGPNSAISSVTCGAGSSNSILSCTWSVSNEIQPKLAMNSSRAAHAPKIPELAPWTGWLWLSAELRASLLSTTWKHFDGLHTNPAGRRSGPGSAPRSGPQENAPSWRPASIAVPCAGSSWRNQHNPALPARTSSATNTCGHTYRAARVALDKTHSWWRVGVSGPTSTWGYRGWFDFSLRWRASSCDLGGLEHSELVTDKLCARYVLPKCLACTDSCLRPLSCEDRCADLCRWSTKVSPGIRTDEMSCVSGRTGRWNQLGAVSGCLGCQPSRHFVCGWDIGQSPRWHGIGVGLFPTTSPSNFRWKPGDSMSHTQKRTYKSCRLCVLRRCRNPPASELLTFFRWGLFLIFCRSHQSGHPKTPWRTRISTSNLIFFFLHQPDCWPLVWQI